jgi:hypothetical protein
MPQYKKKVSDGVGFASKEAYEYNGAKFEADLKDGDKIILLNAGVEEEGKWGAQTNFKIKTRNGEKKTAFNQKSINALIDDYGEEGTEWIGKEVNCLLQKTIIGGKKVIVAYFVPDGWKLDEYGELTKLGQATNKKQEDKDETPVVNLDDDNDGYIDPENIPF